MLNVSSKKPAKSESSQADSLAALEAAKQANNNKKAPWGPVQAISVVVILYFVAQFVGGLLVSLYPRLQGWDHNRTLHWLQTSITAQFWYVLIVEAFILGALFWFIRSRQGSIRALGLGRWRGGFIWDGVLGFAAYFVIYLAFAALVGILFPHIHWDQQQDVGFNNPSGSQALILTFISLVIFPPIAEEIIFRGFLYTTLRSRSTMWVAGIITSLIFASAHLLEGVGGGLLWVAGIDTFVLSMVLIYLRERTGQLYAGMLVHALKNGLAFVVLYHVALGLGS